MNVSMNAKLCQLEVSSHNSTKLRALPTVTLMIRMLLNNTSPIGNGAVSNPVSTPVKVTVPPMPTARTDRVSVWAPTTSITASAPCPSVSRLTSCSSRGWFGS
jgi:hypothetical protein